MARELNESTSAASEANLPRGSRRCRDRPDVFLQRFAPDREADNPRCYFAPNRSRIEISKIKPARAVQRGAACFVAHARQIVVCRARRCLALIGLTNTCARLVESPDNAKGSDDKGKIVSAPCDHRNDAVASCHSGARAARSEFLLQILPRIWSVGDCGLNASVRKRTEFGAAAGVENDRNRRGRGLGRDRCGDAGRPATKLELDLQC